MSPDREPTGSADEPALFAERERLERELGHLPIDQRAILVLHFYVGLPLTEAAPYSIFRPERRSLDCIGVSRRSAPR